MRTPHSVTDPAELIAIAEAIRRRGYEYVVDDFIIGLAALGVPVFSQAGDFIGVVSVALLQNSAEGRASPFPGQTHATRSVTGVPRAVKRLSTATRM